MLFHQDPCPDCGFDASTTRPDQVAGLVRANAAAWPSLLADPRAATRPDPATWSALEYACHVRDVLRLYEVRLNWMLDEDDPLFANWDQDVTAVEEAYGTQDPATVATELAAAAEVIADHFESLPPRRGPAPAVAATAPRSPSTPSPATSCTTRSTTRGTPSPATARLGAEA